MAKRKSPYPIPVQLYHDLMREDELGVVIRAHMYIEQQLNLCIDKLIPYPAALRQMELKYSQRVRLLVALGLKEELKEPLLAIGNIRNHFAHHLDAVLTEGRVNDFYKNFSSGDKVIIQKTLDKMQKDFEPDEKGKMKDYIPRDRFIMLVLNLVASLIAYRL